MESCCCSITRRHDTSQPKEEEKEEYKLSCSSIMTAKTPRAPIGLPCSIPEDKSSTLPPTPRPSPCCGPTFHSKSPLAPEDPSARRSGVAAVPSSPEDGVAGGEQLSEQRRKQLVHGAAGEWDTAHDEWTSTMRFVLVMLATMLLFLAVVSVAVSVKTSRSNRRDAFEQMGTTTVPPSTSLLAPNDTDSTAAAFVDVVFPSLSHKGNYRSHKPRMHHEKILSRGNAGVAVASGDLLAEPLGVPSLRKHYDEYRSTHSTESPG